MTERRPESRESAVDSQPERGPLPPLPLELQDENSKVWKALATYLEHRGQFRATEFVDKLFDVMKAYAITYAAAEVARLAGQAVAEIHRDGNDGSIRLVRWTDAAKNLDAGDHMLGVIATPSADGADGVRAKYHELLYAVGNKHPGESRHETALRYIKRAEEPSEGGAKSRAANGEGDA